MAEQFILYACPVGELATQIETYFAASEQQCGRNAAHHYMPHCTLTGFFRDEDEALAVYGGAIARAFTEQLTADPSAPITLQAMTFRSDWHGLEIQSDWLQQLAARFVKYAHSPTRQEALRLKTWLHLSLAYDFHPDQAEALQQLAQAHINPRSPVSWEIRFYQHHADHRWTCHYTWLLPAIRSKAS